MMNTFLVSVSDPQENPDNLNHCFIIKILKLTQEYYVLKEASSILFSHICEMHFEFDFINLINWGKNSHESISRTVCIIQYIAL